MAHSAAPAGNDTDPALSWGYFYLEQQNYLAAVVEFKRFLFFNPNHEKVAQAQQGLSRVYAEQGQWDLAQTALLHAILSTNSDSIADCYRMLRASYLMAQGQWSSAEFELSKLVHFSQYMTIKEQASILMGMCQIYQSKWQPAREKFALLKARLPAADYRQIDSLLQVGCHLKYRSPGAAKWLSTFLPGTGQMYAGHWQLGINALALNTATGYMLYNAATTGRIGDILIIYLALFDRYYQGNRANAEKAAKAYNNHKNQQLAREILSLLKRVLAE